MVITAASKKALEKSTKQRRVAEDKAVLLLVKQFTAETRLPPTYSQLAERHGCSKNKIWRILHRLEAAGKIELGASQTRSIRIVRRPRAQAPS